MKFTIDKTDAEITIDSEPERLLAIFTVDGVDESTTGVDESVGADAIDATGGGGGGGDCDDADEGAGGLVSNTTAMNG